MYLPNFHDYGTSGFWIIRHLGPDENLYQLHDKFRHMAFVMIIVYAAKRYGFLGLCSAWLMGYGEAALWGCNACGKSPKSTYGY
jgi:hypothetical protein